MSRRLVILLLCFTLLFGAAGCSTASLNGTDSAAAAAAKWITAAAAASGDKAVSNNEKSIDEDVFPKDKVIDVNITMKAEDFQDMLDNASKEEFKTASVDYNGKHFDNVAVRTKGNLSLRSVVNSDSDRYSFKISFDEYISSQTLYGISKINLNNNYSDASYMREFLAYELAEQMGLPTPKYSFVNVYVNGELKGFYLAVEQIGESYLERNFGDAYGALYKANGGSGSELNWLESIQSYTGLDLKSESSDGSVLLDMVDELNNGTDYDQVLDVDEALKFIALNVLTANMDSYLGSNKHNYYLYEQKGVFSILPWDYNMAFGGLGGTSLLIDEPTQGALSDRPLIDKLLKVDAYKEKYHQILKDALDGYLADDTFKARVQELSAMISSYVEKDPTAFYTYEQYQQGVTQLTAFNAQIVESFTKQLDGTSPSFGDGSGSGGGPGGGMGRNGGKQQGNAVKAKAAADGQAQGGQAQGGLAAPNANGQAQGGQTAPNANGQMQGGPGGGMGGMGGGPGGMDGGPGGGMGGGPEGQGTQPAGSISEALTAGSMVIVLLLACVFVTQYRRKRG
ncbi:CotH kinase family protein [Paenibacillus sp. TAB 01]|uniref:CotH kinase family protein n=1 Tax=Paenibacillus sp. TAB 01 TaxID=3368988 RepID=UPI003751544A